MVASTPSSFYCPYHTEIYQAKSELCDFILSEKGQELVDFTIWQKVIQASNREERVPFFSRFIQKADSLNLLDKTVQRVFFANIDRLAFVNAVIKNIWRKIVPNHQESSGPSEMEIIMAQELLLDYVIHNKSLAKVQDGISWQLEGFEGNFDMAYHDTDERRVPIRSLFVNFMKEEMRSGNLPEECHIFFSLSHEKQKEFIQWVAKELFNRSPKRSLPHLCILREYAPFAASLYT